MTSFSRYYNKDKVLINVTMTNIADLCKDSNNKTLIAEHIYERLYTRFLKIFDFASHATSTYCKDGVNVQRNIFDEEYKNGFLMLTSCSLLIETLASFISGKDETPWGQSTNMFNKVFEYADTKNNGLKVFKGTAFYDNIRCGLLHQGETYGKFKITRQGEVLLKGDTIDAYLFFKSLKQLLLSYKNDLATESWDSQTWQMCRDKINYITTNAN